MFNVMLFEGEDIRSSGGIKCSIHCLKGTILVLLHFSLWEYLLSPGIHSQIFWGLGEVYSVQGSSLYLMYTGLKPPKYYQEKNADKMNLWEIM